ncbi:MAG: GNAT family N-acetyltransferase [Mesorhizobium sp.]
MLFADHGYPALAAAAPASPERYRAMLRERRALVAADSHDQPVGFALTEQTGRVEWLCELSVHPDHGRRGIGGALVEAVAEAARGRGCGRIGLSTFRSLPFNAPFYARHGFAEVPLDGVDPPIERRFHAEVPAGVDPRERVLMVKVL